MITLVVADIAVIEQPREFGAVRHAFQVGNDGLIRTMGAFPVVGGLGVLCGKHLGIDGIDAILDRFNSWWHAF